MDCSVNGGNSEYSYSKNSKFQRNAIHASKELINKGVSEKLDINILTSSKTFQIADLGCAAGPNTFIAVQNIIDSVELKYKHKNRELIDFQVYFNDNASNDFNQLFNSFPTDRRYFAAGVPGSFHGRLFPNDSLHFVHSSYSMQILSRIPEKVLDKNSLAWNRGRIHYSGSSDEVAQAYRAQYSEDMDVFLKARAEEIVSGGLMALIVPAWLEGTPYSESFLSKTVEIVGSCFVDLANKGTISHEEVDSFNLPMYFACPEEMRSVVKRNGCFEIEIMEYTSQQNPTPTALACSLRSGMGAFIQSHFGQDVSDELFNSLSNKFEDNHDVFESKISGSLFVLLKRNTVE